MSFIFTKVLIKWFHIFYFGMHAAPSPRSKEVLDVKPARPTGASLSLSLSLSLSVVSPACVGFLRMLRFSLGQRENS